MAPRITGPFPADTPVQLYKLWDKLGDDYPLKTPLRIRRLPDRELSLCNKLHDSGYKMLAGTRFLAFSKNRHSPVDRQLDIKLVMWNESCPAIPPHKIYVMSKSYGLVLDLAVQRGLLKKQQESSGKWVEIPLTQQVAEPSSSSSSPSPAAPITSAITSVRAEVMGTAAGTVSKAAAAGTAEAAAAAAAREAAAATQTAEAAAAQAGACIKHKKGETVGEGQGAATVIGHITNSVMILEGCVVPSTGMDAQQSLCVRTAVTAAHAACTSATTTTSGFASRCTQNVAKHVWGVNTPEADGTLFHALLCAVAQGDLHASMTQSIEGHDAGMALLHAFSFYKHNQHPQLPDCVASSMQQAGEYHSTVKVADSYSSWLEKQSEGQLQSLSEGEQQLVQIAGDTERFHSVVLHVTSGTGKVVRVSELLSAAAIHAMELLDNLRDESPMGLSSNAAVFKGAKAFREDTACFARTVWQQRLSYCESLKIGQRWQSTASLVAEDDELRTAKQLLDELAHSSFLDNVEEVQTQLESRNKVYHNEWLVLQSKKAQVEAEVNAEIAELRKKLTNM